MIGQGNSMNEKEREMNDMVKKMEAGERRIADCANTLKRDGIDINSSNSEAILELVKSLSHNVEILNVEIRSKNQLKINSLTKKVRAPNTVVGERKGDF